MKKFLNIWPCEQNERVAIYALRALPSAEIPDVEVHLASCEECREQLEHLQPVVDCLADWPTDDMRPSDSVRQRLASRIATETGREILLAPGHALARLDWDEVAPGISCKILSNDAERDRVSMLVRLAPGVEYPPHEHAGVEELHLLDGELWIDERKLHPGDYSRAEAGTFDRRVWSETGCTCVLTTSPSDVLR